VRSGVLARLHHLVYRPPHPEGDPIVVCFSLPCWFALAALYLPHSSCPLDKIPALIVLCLFFFHRILAPAILSLLLPFTFLPSAFS